MRRWLFKYNSYYIIAKLLCEKHYYKYFSCIKQLYEANSITVILHMKYLAKRAQVICPKLQLIQIKIYSVGFQHLPFWPA
jgi:phage tail protein X